MNIRIITSLAVVAIILGGVLSFTSPVMAQASSTPIPGSTNASADDFTPEIPLPGLFEGAQRTDNNLMAHYIRAIYIYFVWTVSIVAVIMVMYGGIRWVTAAGNPGQIKDARDIIDSAVIGVIIALASIVLLNIINPRLTNLYVPGLAKVKPTTPNFATFNKDWGCYENLGCPSGWNQVTAEQCSPLGTDNILTVNPGNPSCAANTSGGICCRGTTKDTLNTCVKYWASDLSSKVADPCGTAAAPVIKYTACTDTTACGTLRDTGVNTKCIGVNAGTDAVCYIKDHNGNGVSIAPSTSGGTQSYTFDALPQCVSQHKAYTMVFDSSIACGSGANVGGVGHFGTKNTCQTGSYCAITGFPNDCGEYQGYATICRPFADQV